MKAHEQACGRRPWTCGRCGGVYAADEMEKHVAGECPNLPTECPARCGAKVERRLLERHLASDCPFRMVPCPYHEVGCTAQLRACEVQDHVAANGEAHALLLQRELVAERSRREAAEKRMSSLESVVAARFEHLEARQAKLEEESARHAAFADDARSRRASQKSPQEVEFDLMNRLNLAIDRKLTAVQAAAEAGGGHHGHHGAGGAAGGSPGGRKPSRRRRSAPVGPVAQWLWFWC